MCGAGSSSSSGGGSSGAVAKQLVLKNWNDVVSSKLESVSVVKDDDGASMNNSMRSSRGDLSGQKSMEEEMSETRSAEKLQGFVRSRLQNLEKRRKAATSMHEMAEYAEERRQKISLDSFIEALRDQAPDKLQKKFRGQSAVDELRATSKWPFDIEIEDGYEGLHLPDPPTKDAMIDMMDQVFVKVKAESRASANEPDLPPRIGLKGLVHIKYALAVSVRFLDAIRKEPSIGHISTAITSRLTVVGDVHGQLRDLVHIFRHNGLPSFDNPYLFNGDLVDRGPYSTEVLLLLMGFALADPYSVYFNRGNHEDMTVSHVYGFVSELDMKYGVESENGKRLYDVFELCFANLPICHVIDQNILVVHGGLTDKLSHLDKLKGIQRHLHPTLTNHYHIKLHAGHSNKHKHTTQDILRDLVWSDPIVGDDVSMTKCEEPNPLRGTGVAWPAGLTESFLKKNHLGVLIRSHQCKDRGWEVTHNGRCLTLFSASNYYSEGATENDGAVLVLQPSSPPQIFTYRTTTVTTTASLAECVACVEREALDRVEATLLDHRRELVRVFHDLDPKDTGTIPLHKWARAMNSTVPIKLPWAHLAEKFVVIQSDGVTVEYKPFLKRLERVFVRSSSSSDTIDGELRETLHRRRHELTFLFHLLDTESNGHLDKKTLAEACKLLNKLSTGNAKPFKDADVEKFLKQLDVDRDGTVSFTDFVTKISSLSQQDDQRNSFVASLSARPSFANLLQVVDEKQPPPSSSS